MPDCIAPRRDRSRTIQTPECEHLAVVQIAEAMFMMDCKRFGGRRGSDFQRTPLRVDQFLPMALPHSRRRAPVARLRASARSALSAVRCDRPPTSASSKRTAPGRRSVHARIQTRVAETRVPARGLRWASLASSDARRTSSSKPDGQSGERHQILPIVLEDDADNGLCISRTERTGNSWRGISNPGTSAIHRAPH